MDLDWQKFVPMLAAYLVSLSWHESAHAWTAWRLGDPTGKALGRISLNPLRHIDPIGTIVVPLVLWMTAGVMFGWAKPVPYNPYALRNPALGSAMVAGAGPVSNFLLAVVAALALAFLHHSGAARFELGLLFLYSTLLVNVWLGVFNLIPLPPLDGGTVVGGLLPRRLAYAWERNQMVLYLVLVLVMVSGAHRPFVSAVSKAIIDPLLRLAGVAA